MRPSLFDFRLQRAQQTRRYSIESTEPSGWLVRFEENRSLRRDDCYHDWHRVERALALFRFEVTSLRASGWEIAPNDLSR
jgi:hypothetical protein